MMSDSVVIKLRADDKENPDDRGTESVSGIEMGNPSDEADVQNWKAKCSAEDFLIVDRNAERDRTEAKLHQLSKSEHALFDSSAVSKILRRQLNPEQVLRCRWICVWKCLDSE